MAIFRSLPSGFRLFWCLGLLAPLAGCDTLTTALRDELALESEMLDRVTLVVNDSTATAYQKPFEERARNKLDKITKLKEEKEKDLDDTTRVAWDNFMATVREMLAEPITDATFKTIDAMGKPGQPARRIAELKQRVRDADTTKDENKFPQKESEWEKVLLKLPTDKFLNHYMREKLALHVARQREVNRLAGILKANPSSDMQTIVDVLKGQMTGGPGQGGQGPGGPGKGPPGPGGPDKGPPGPGGMDKGPPGPGKGPPGLDGPPKGPGPK